MFNRISGMRTRISGQKGSGDRGRSGTNRDSDDEGTRRSPGGGTSSTNRASSASGSRSATSYRSGTGTRAASAGTTRPSNSPTSFEQLYSDPPPSFREVSSSERQTLFVKKLHLCSFCFDFSDSTKQTREKEVKRQTLLELVDYVNTGHGKFTEAVFPDIVHMVSSNLFRALPASNHEMTGSASYENFDPEEDEPNLDPSWPHLQASIPPIPSAEALR